jgi:hypothetical protein
MLDGHDCGLLGKPRLGANRVPHDPAEVEDRQLQDEHHEDDLDHEPKVYDSRPRSQGTLRADRL